MDSPEIADAVTAFASWSTSCPIRPDPDLTDARESLACKGDGQTECRRLKVHDSSTAKGQRSVRLQRQENPLLASRRASVGVLHSLPDGVRRWSVTTTTLERRRMSRGVANQRGYPGPGSDGG
jgi:hypothetical protein